MIRRVISRLAQGYIGAVHASRSRYRHGRAPERSGEWQDQPLDPNHIIEGDPVARALEFGETGDRGASFGAWDCTAGRFRWYYYCDEIISVIEGEAFVEIDGKEEHLVAGSVFYFPFGAVARWYVPEYVRKHYVLRHPARLVGKFI